MRKLLILIPILCLFACWNPDSKLKQNYEQNLKKELSSGHQITPFPGEHPAGITPATKGLSLTNWGKDLLLTPATQLRLVAECKNPVVVKVFDTSGKTNHQLLQTGQLPGTSYTGESALDDGNGHGTHCAGIICANQLGLCDALVQAGIIKWKPVKVLNNSGSGDFAWITTAVQTEDVENRSLLAKGTYVVGSCSFGGGTALIPQVETALKSSTDLGVLYSVAAGNSGTAGVNYPGMSPYSICVGSIGQSKVHSSFESTGPEIWEGMPGEAILSCYLNNTTATLSGTSMATPFGAGILAIMRSKWGNTNLSTLAQVKNYLAWTANDLESPGKDNYTGWGDELVNSILDHNPKDAPNVPNNPGPPTPPGQNPHTVRSLTFSVSTPLVIYWNNLNPQGQTTSVLAGGPAGTEALTITSMEVTVNNSLVMAPAEYATFVANTKWFFTNRGLQLQGGSDYNDATYWASYFFELLVKTQSTTPESLHVTKINAIDVKGNVCTLYDTQLKHFTSATAKGHPWAAYIK